MSTSPCGVIAAEEGYQTCALASNQPEIYITHIYITNPDASDPSPVELSAAAKAFMLQQAIQQQKYQQRQARQKNEGSTGSPRRSSRQRRRPRHFSPKEVRIPATRRRQGNASYQLVCASLLCLPPLVPSAPPVPKNLKMKGKIIFFNEGFNEFKKYIYKKTHH